MSVGLTGSLAYSVAGTPLAQTSSGEQIRARQDVIAQQRSQEATQQTEDASGIGQTDGEDNQTNERDADGRSPWLLGRKTPLIPEDEVVEEPAAETPLLDADAETGGHIDLSG